MGAPVKKYSGSFHSWRAHAEPTTHVFLEREGYEPAIVVSEDVCDACGASEFGISRFVGDVLDRIPSSFTTPDLGRRRMLLLLRSTGHDIVIHECLSCGASYSFTRGEL